MKRPTLRAATLEDEGAVLDLLTVAAEYNEFPFGKFERDVAGGAFRDCVNSGAVLLSLSGDVPVGTMGLEMSGIWWGRTKLLVMHWLFVHPQNRLAPHARSLLRLAKSVTDNAEVPLVPGVMTGKRAEAKMRLFESEFGKPIGATFLWGTT